MRKTNIFRFAWIIALIGLFGFESLQAQETNDNSLWSLEKCIIYAKENNISIQRQKLNIELAEKNLLESKLSYVPTLNAAANNVINWGQTIDRYTNQFATNSTRSNNFSLSAQLDLFSGFQKLHNLKQKQLALQINQYNVDKMIDDVSLNITTYYLQVLFYKELVKVAQSQLEITKMQVSRTQKLVDAGTLAKGDLYNIQAQEATEELNLVETENNLEISMLTLAQLLDLNNEAHFDIEQPDLDVEAEMTPASSGAVYDYAVNHQPEILAAELNVDQTDVEIKLAKSQYYPSLNLYGTWATGYSGAAQEAFNTQMGLYPMGIVQNTMDTVMGFTSFSDYRTSPLATKLRTTTTKALAFI